MPVEIKELIIRTNVTAGIQSGHDQGSNELSALDKRRIIDACTKEVLRAMQKQDER